MSELPHSAESERAVLAAVLLEPTLFADLHLAPDEFYLERHAQIWRVFGALAAADQALDLRTVQAELERRGELKAVGGLAYLAALDLDLPDLGRAETYAEIVRERARRRRLIVLAERAAARARDGVGGDAEELAAATRRELEALEDGGGEVRGDSAAELVGEVLSDVTERIAERERTGRAVLGLPTGMPTLDGLLGGLGRGFYLLAGAPGMGKTTMSLGWALHVARTAPVVVATFENSGHSLTLKALCQHAGLNTRDVMRGYGDVGALQRAAEELAPQLARLDLIDGDGRLTVGRLRSRARRAMERAGSSRCLVVVDYLQLWAKVSRELRAVTDVRAKVDVLGAELIALARQLDSPILALSSQSRAGGNYGSEGGVGRGSSRLDSLKESGDLEYAADAAMFLTEPSPDEVRATPPAVALRVTVAKHRHGPTGQVDLIFRKELSEIRELAAER